jgi:hypothetical protein
MMIKDPTAQLTAVSASGFFLRRGGGKGGSHPSDVEDRCCVLAMDRKADSIYDAVEA